MQRPWNSYLSGFLIVWAQRAGNNATLTTFVETLKRITISKFIVWEISTLDIPHNRLYWRLSGACHTSSTLLYLPKSLRLYKPTIAAYDLMGHCRSLYHFMRLNATKVEARLRNRDSIPLAVTYLGQMCLSPSWGGQPWRSRLCATHPIPVGDLNHSFLTPSMQ